METTLYTLISRDWQSAVPLISTEHRHLLPQALQVISMNYTLECQQLKNLLIFSDQDLRARGAIPINASGESTMLFVHTTFDAPHSLKDSV